MQSEVKRQRNLITWKWARLSTPFTRLPAQPLTHSASSAPASASVIKRTLLLLDAIDTAFSSLLWHNLVNPHAPVWFIRYEQNLSHDADQVFFGDEDFFCDQNCFHHFVLECTNPKKRKTFWDVYPMRHDVFCRDAALRSDMLQEKAYAIVDFCMRRPSLMRTIAWGLVFGYCDTYLDNWCFFEDDPSLGWFYEGPIFNLSKDVVQERSKNWIWKYLLKVPAFQEVLQEIIGVWQEKRYDRYNQLLVQKWVTLSNAFGCTQKEGRAISCQEIQNFWTERLEVLHKHNASIRRVPKVLAVIPEESLDGAVGLNNVVVHSVQPSTEGSTAKDNKGEELVAENAQQALQRGIKSTIR